MVKKEATNDIMNLIIIHFNFEYVLTKYGKKEIRNHPDC